MAWKGFTDDGDSATKTVINFILSATLQMFSGHKVNVVVTYDDDVVTYDDDVRYYRL